MFRATGKDILRTIRRSLSRFLSITLIIAIGVAFFAGLTSSGSDMRLTADKYYRDSYAQDVQILSTLGFSDTDLQAIRSIDGVDQAVGGYFVDCLTLCEDNFPTHVLSLPDNPSAHNDAYLNRLRVLEGRLPVRKNECVIDHNMVKEFGFAVGDTVRLGSAVKGEHLSDTLRNTKFKVVGVVNSPLYIDSSRRGSTTVGDGSLDAYLYIPEANFTFDFYTQVAVTYTPAWAFACYDDGYADAVQPLKDELEALGKDRAVPRMKEMKASLLAQVKDGEKELEKGRQELDEAKAQLDEARAQLESSRQELAQGRNEYENGLNAFQDQIASAAGDLSGGQAQLNEARAQYQSYLRQYEEGCAELERQEQTLEQAEQKLPALKAAYHLLHARLQMMEQIDTSTAEGRTLLLWNVRDITPAMNVFTDAEGNSLRLGDLMYADPDHTSATTQSVHTAHTALTAYYEDTTAQITSGREQLESGREQLAQTKQQLDRFKAELDRAEQQLAAGQQQLEDSQSAAQQELNDARNELEAGEAALSAGEKEFLKQEESAQKEFRKAEKQLKEAEHQLRNAKRQIRQLSPAEWYIQDRNESCYGFSNFSDDADRMDSLSTVFPVFFLAVASLVSLTTLTRMVDEHRTEIGTFKALGYKTFQIRRKYSIYSLSATLLGCVLGLTAGFRIFPTVIISAYCMMYDLPQPQTPFHPAMALACTVVALVCVYIVTHVACRSILKEVPSQIMRPKAPPAGKRIPLEYIRPLWRRLSFSRKVTCRNLFRYGKRVLMTIFGIAGSSALVLTGFGLQDAISDMGQLQFENVFHYDLLAGYSSQSQADQEKLCRFLDENDLVADWQLQARQTLHTGGDHEEYLLNLVVTEDTERLTDYISLHERVSGQSIEVPDEGVVVTEKLASLLELSPGDTLTLQDRHQKLYDLTVTAITENYAEHFLYLSDDYYREVFGEAPEYNSVILHTTDDSQMDQLKEELLSSSMVQMVSDSAGLLERANYLTDNLGYVVAVLIISAGLLAFVVLYNLSNININERVREIATLKVLGFHDNEVSAYIFRESHILALLGTAIGLGLGTVFLRFVITTAETDAMMFGRHIDVSSFIMSALLTFLFSLIVNVVMHFRIKRISMVSSLKAVE